MKRAEDLMREVLDTRVAIRDQLVTLIWSELEKVVDSDAGIRHLINKGYIPKPQGIEEDYKELMQKLKTRNKFDDETVKYFNKVVEDEVKSRMAELGWKFDEKGNIASLKEQ